MRAPMMPEWTYGFTYTIDDQGHHLVDLFVSESGAPLPADYVPCERATFVDAWKQRDRLDVERLMAAHMRPARRDIYDVG